MSNVAHEPTCTCPVGLPTGAVEHFIALSLKVTGSSPCPVHLGDKCPLGVLGLHTYNYEQTECIWCGPNRLATKPGRWVDTGDGLDAWSVE